MKQDSQHRQGLISIALAFWLWGVVVIFWKQLDSYDSVELILHRFIWSFLILIAALWLRGDLGSFWKSFHDWRLVRLHFINGLLISCNWFAYVYAVNHDKVLESSLAYFIVPVLNTAMGLLFLKERLNRLQWAAITLATLGVLNEIVQFGSVPWLAVVMASTFGFYGLRKTRSELGPVRALAMETGATTPRRHRLVGLSPRHLQGDSRSLPTNPPALDDFGGIHHRNATTALCLWSETHPAHHYRRVSVSRAIDHIFRRRICL